jgi:hypothetical protein
MGVSGMAQDHTHHHDGENRDPKDRGEQPRGE